MSQEAQLAADLKAKAKKVRLLEQALAESEHRTAMLRNELYRMASLLPRATPGARRRAIIVDGAYPDPQADSGSIDTILQVRFLRSAGFEVFVFATEGAGPREPLEREGAILPDEPLVGWLGREADAVGLVFLFRFHRGGLFLEWTRSRLPAARIVFQPVDLHGLREARRAEVTGNTKLAARAEAMLAREVELAARADAVVVLSQAEADLLKQRAPSAKVWVMPIVREASETKIALSERRGVGFIGSFRHAPNIDALHWLFEDIWPRVLQVVPDATLRVAGADFDPALIPSPPFGVVLDGQVADAGAWIQQFRLTVAPLRFGAGAKGKVVSSLVQGVPCVATSVAVEGMQFEDEAGADGVIVADGPEDIAQALIKVLRAEDYAGLALSAASRGTGPHLAEAGAARFSKLLDALAAESSVAPTSI